MSTSGGGWVCLVPAKPPSVGKSRLGLPAEARQELATAFALDTVTAARLTSRVEVVLAVTDDARFADRLAMLGCQVVPDGVGGDLNGSLVQAAAEARRRWPGLRPFALCADLPALRPTDLDEALTVAGDVDGASYVADADGVGTTLYTAPYDGFAPRFGRDSSAAHTAAGATPVGGDLASLRRDVDTAADVRTAAALGLGAHSAAAVARLEI